MPKVFVCYSLCDRRWVGHSPGCADAAFVPWLRDKLRHDKIDLWWSAELDNTVAEVADRRIAEAIATSDMAILLVSDDFFISDYIVKKELPAIRSRVERGEIQVFPVVVDHVTDWGQSDHAAWIYALRIHPAAITPLAVVSTIPARWEKVRSIICGAVTTRLLTPRPASEPGGEVAGTPWSGSTPPPAPALPATFGSAARLEELRRREEAHRKAEEAARKVAATLLAEAKEAFRVCTEIEGLKSATPDEKAAAWEEYLQHYSETGYEVDKALARIAFQRKPGDLRSINLGGETMNLRWCPQGMFAMGSPATEADRRDHEGPVEVTLTKGFWIGETPVTVAQFGAFVRATGYRTEAEAGDGAHRWKGAEWERDKIFDWRNPGFAQSELCPVTCVSWNDASRFAAWAQMALPTEAQWEYACRAGTSTPFHFGATITPDQVNYNGSFPYANGKGRPAKGLYRARTTPVKSFPANAWELRDMHGNVWEWCADRYVALLPGGIDPMRPSNGPTRVLRGGGWEGAALYCRSACRSFLAPSASYNHIGFRVVLPVR